VAEFLGGKHAYFNMGLWRRDAAAKIGAEDLRAVLSRLAGPVDIVNLVNSKCERKRLLGVQGVFATPGLRRRTACARLMTQP